MSQSLHNALINDVSNGYWDTCNSHFDRGVVSAEDMLELNRGNCFSLSAYVCSLLTATEEPSLAGVCIEVLRSGRNYHASSWAICEDSPSGYVRLDLLSERANDLDLPPELTKQLATLAETSQQAIYYSAASAESRHDHLVRQPISAQHVWPEGIGENEMVFLGAQAGATALRVLAEAGGTRHLLPTFNRPDVPSLPRA